jgi:23S rRNA (uracil1939-C5)-methyltransferase
MARRTDPTPGAEVEIAIESLGARGDGIGRIAGGRPVFVAGALPGERVRARLGPPEAAGLRGMLTAVVAASPDRAVPPCPHFGTCGGCAAQHMDGPAYGRWKEALVADALAAEGIEAEIAPLVALPAASRRRARLFAHATAGGPVLGFRAARSHAIVDMADCPALDPRLWALTGPLRGLFSELLAPGARAEAEAQEVDGALDVVLRLPVGLDAALRERLARFAAGAGIARLGWQPLAPRPGRGRHPPVETIVERAPVRAVFGGVPVPLPPLAFLQASRAGETALVGLVTARVPEGAATCDLYAGAGTFTFPLADGRKLAAFDGDAELIGALEGAARKAGLGARITAAVRDLERRPLSADELAPFAACVLDPPRGGAAAQARALAASRVPRVVMVSCNPRSFARDARALVAGGYRLGTVTPVDQFVWTRHLEVVAALAR